MTAEEVLRAMAEDGVLAELVLAGLNQGMFDEWDCDLWTGVPELGFGGPELAIAAKSGAAWMRYAESQIRSKRTLGNQE